MSGLRSICTTDHLSLVDGAECEFVMRRAVRRLRGQRCGVVDGALPRWRCEASKIEGGRAASKNRHAAEFQDSAVSRFPGERQGGRDGFANNSVKILCFE